MEAVDLCVEMNDWHLAFQLTHSTTQISEEGHTNSDANLKPILRRKVISQLRTAVNHCLAQSRLFEAVEMLKDAGYFLDAAKLLYRVSKRFVHLTYCLFRKLKQPKAME